jgi:tripartite-type tricarboxylate transporter receptor subunit TctC
MKAARLVLLAMVSVLVVFTMQVTAQAAWPEKPISMAVAQSVGGGTDTVMRALAKGMEKHLGVPIEVFNRPGAQGSVAEKFVYSKPADGYTWLGCGQYHKPLRVLGYTKLKGWEDWQYYKVTNALQAWAVKPDSPFKTLADFLDAARKNPGKYTVSNSGIGGIWQEGNELLVNEAKVKISQIPYKGGAPATLAVLQGEVDVVSSGLHEQIDFIRTGKLRNLAVFVKDPIKLEDGTVLRPVTDFVPGLAKYAPFGAEHAVGVRRDTPIEIVRKINEAVIAATAAPEFESFLNKIFLFKNVTLGEEADRMAALRESITAWLFWDLKVEGAKVDPATLGIPRPEAFDAWWPPKGYKPLIKK